MEKIIVTEEQEKIISMMTSEGWNKCLRMQGLMGREEFLNLSLIDLARIVEGEPYDIKRGFKVGDIVWSAVTESIFEVTEKGDLKGVSIDCLEINIKEGWRYELVCKVENREYLQ